MPKHRGKARARADRGKADAANDQATAQVDRNVSIDILFPPTHHRTTDPPAGRIEPEGHPPINGRWFAQYFDRAAGVRYSIGTTPDNRFFVLALDDLTRATNWFWFETAAEVWQSRTIPEALKRRPAPYDRLGAWPDEL